MKATDILRSEHEIILDVLGALETICRSAMLSDRLDQRSARQVLEFLRGFGDRCHHGKEEQHLFAVLAARGLPREVGPLAVLMSEHEEGRALLTRMSEALADALQSKPGAPARFGAAGQTYVSLMRDHIDKENGVLFPMGDGMLSEGEQAALLAGFETFELADMGAGAHERFLAIADALCERLGLDRAPRPAASGSACCGHRAR